MRSIAFAFAWVLASSLATTAWAQGCQRGGGAAPATVGSSSAAITGNFVPFGEYSRRMSEQAYRQQMQMAYRQAAYRNQLEAAYVQQEAVAQAKEDKRQQRLANVRQRREQEAARREARRAANLARLVSERSHTE